MGNFNTHQSTEEKVLKTYQDLLNMGFEEHVALNSAYKFKGDLNKCIEHITSIDDSKDSIENESNKSTVDTQESHEQANPEAKISDQNDENDKKQTNPPPPVISFDGGYCNPQTCMSVQRIRKFLVFYQQSMHRITKYSHTNKLQLLLDDHIHILKQHSNELEQICNIITVNCNLNECQSVRRNYRNRINESKKKSNSDLSIEDKVTMDIMDQIHSYFLHTFDIGYRLTNTEKQSLVVDQKENDNEDENEEISFIKLNSVLKKKRQNYDSISARKQNSKFVTTFNYQQPEMKYNDCVEQPHIIKKDKVGGKLLVYSFSEPFKYVQNADMHSIDDKGIPVSKKYADLKDEILNNALCSIDADTWVKVQQKVQQYLECGYVRRKKDPFFLPVHLTVIILYTDYDDLSYKFSESFRKLRAHETVTALVARHRNYYWFASLLLKTVKIHSCTSQNSHQYHGISTMMSFNTTIAEFNHPTSTTKRIEVASHFATNSGVILELQTFKDSWSHGDVKYLDCSWLSAYANEDEMLYFRSEALQFSNIIICATGNTCRKYLHPFNIFISAMNGYSINKSGRRSETTSTTEQKLIISMLSNEINVDEYFMSIFNQYKKSKTYVKVDIYYMTRKGFGGYTFLGDILLTKPNEPVNTWMDIKLLLHLFVNCKEIILTHLGHKEPVYITKEYMDCICSSLLQCQNIMNSLERIIIENATIPKMCKKLDIQQFNKKMKQFLFEPVTDKLIIRNLKYEN